MTSKTQQNFKKVVHLLKIFLSNDKISLIPPLFYSYQLFSDFKHKAGIFNDFFSNQFSLNNNNSKLPANINDITDKELGHILGHISS